MSNVSQMYETYITYTTFDKLAKAGYVGAKVASTIFVPSVHTLHCRAKLTLGAQMEWGVNKFHNSSSLVTSHVFIVISLLWLLWLYCVL